MAAITFTPKTGTTSAETVEITAEIMVAEPKPVAIAPARPTSKIRRSDILIPRINLVQKTGKLCDDFAPGTFLFEKQVVLAKPGEAFSAVVLGDEKYFQEKVEYGSPEFGRRAEDEEEVRKLGGSVTYGVTDKPYFQAAADFLIAVQAPADATPEQLNLFAFLSPEGTHYALAAYTVSSSSYTSLAKRIFTDKLFTLKDGLHLAEYAIKSELKRHGANSWYVPVANMPKRYNDPVKTKFFEELKNL